MLLRLVRPLSDPVDRRPVRRGRRQRVRAIHRRGRRPHPGDRRRLSRHQREPRVAEAARRAKRQRRADQGQPGGNGERSQSGFRRSARAPASGRSSRRVRARPRTFRSFILRSAGAPDSSRSVRSRAPNGWRSGTRPCASRRRSARRRASPASMKCRCDVRRRNRSKRALDGEFDDEQSVHRERRARDSGAGCKRRSRLQGHSLCRAADRAIALAPA